MLGIAVVLPGSDFADQGLLVGDAAVEALGGEDAEFGFDKIKPAAVLGRVCDSKRSTNGVLHHGLFAGSAGRFGPVCHDHSQLCRDHT